MRPVPFAAALLLAGCSQPADEPGVAGGKPEIAFAGPRARATVAGQTATAGYLTIANFGAGGDRLVSVEAQPPVTAMLHATEIEDGVARMRPLADGLAIPGRRSVTLAPGGLHLMIGGLAKPLAPGDTLPLTLRFAKSGDKAVLLRVLDPAEG